MSKEKLQNFIKHSEKVGGRGKELSKYYSCYPHKCLYPLDLQYLKKNIPIIFNSFPFKIILFENEVINILNNKNSFEKKINAKINKNNFSFDLESNKIFVISTKIVKDSNKKFDNFCKKNNLNNKNYSKKCSTGLHLIHWITSFKETDVYITGMSVLSSNNFDNIYNLASCHNYNNEGSYIYNNFFSNNKITVL